ncbi:MAG TPA: hypothetical protein PLI93_13555 [Gemmatimonadales bacterium]|nr:hypothetical protein [Gemmatimonadales bacterium]HPF63073.1 hypothetical protein [Gemmatimonadales bacterium]HRX19593.1 hypothetical protein [Gemmatimonadales bacterium]
MPILDLVTPWAAAAESPDTLAAFTDRHHELLEALRRQRAPSADALALPRDLERARTVASDPTVHALVRAERDRWRERGLRAPVRIVLGCGAEPGATWEVLPGTGEGEIVLFVDRASGDDLVAALAAALATYTRWTADTPVARVAARGPWDRWAAARELPLAEWVYAAGLAVHAAAARFPDWSAERLLGLSRGEVRRLRALERELMLQLEAELDTSGIGLVLRWLTDEAPPGLRTDATGRLVPRGAGRYLGWRMLAERVRRVGVAGAAVG